jgi:hypothetical protein
VLSYAVGTHTYKPLLSCNLTRLSTNRRRTQSSFQSWIMASRDLSRMCTGSEGSSHHGVEVEMRLERLRRSERTRFQLFVVRTAYSPRGTDQPGVLPSPRRVASSSSSPSRNVRISRPSSSRTGPRAALYSAYFSVAIRRISKSIGAETADCSSLTTYVESTNSGISPSRSAAMVSRILRYNESPQMRLVVSKNLPSNRTDEIEIDNDTPRHSLRLEGRRCV